MLRVDLHVHSNYSHDGRSTLAQLVERATECGLDRIALTDHNAFDGAANLVRMAPNLAIGGEEVKTREGEVIGLFITSRVHPYLAPEEAMDIIHGMGGLVYLPHPLDRSRSHFLPERVVALADRIDIVETYNPWCDPAANEAAARLADDLRKVTATGSDAHSVEELGLSWMEMEEYAGPRDFVEKLRFARHVVTASSGTGGVPDAPELLVVGSIALDTREGPFGKVHEELGGSAVYFALAASLILPVKLSAPVGTDAAERMLETFEGRPVDTSLLQVLDAPTYRWKARQEHGRNVDLGSSDSIYDAWEPQIPEIFAGWAFVGSMRPDRQAQAMKALHHSARLLAADAMLSYVKSQPPEAKDVLRRASWFFCNEDEFAALGGANAEEFRRQWWLDGLVLKSGPGGVTAHTADGRVHVPALLDHPAFDTTGAGDAVAGGMLARWLITGAQRSGLQDALVCGVACASLTIESIGIRGIATATPKLLEDRMAEVWECMRRES